MSIERDSAYYCDYYSSSQEYKLHYSKSVYFEMWKIVLSLIPENIPLIELGCGTGQFASMCIDNEKKYSCGYDFSLEAIGISKNIHNLNVCKLADIYKIKIPSHCLLVALEVFEHIRDFKLIDNIGLGKEIIFSVPDFDNPAHIRYFHSVNEVAMRYNNVIKFDYIQKFEKWFVCKGTTI